MPEPMVRKSLMLPREVLQRLEDWRRQRSPIPSEADAVRTLLDAGLELAERGLSSRFEEPEPAPEPRRKRA